MGLARKQIEIKVIIMFVKNKFFFGIIMMIFLFSCKSEPYFKEVDFKILSKDRVDTLIINNDYLFIHIFRFDKINFPPGDGEHYYLLYRKTKCVQLMVTSLFNIEVINDSIICAYDQFFTVPYGDFWLIKSKTSYTVCLDQKTTNNPNIIYKNGKIIRIDTLKVDIDSLKIKKLKNSIYKLENDSLVFIDTFSHVKNDDYNFFDFLKPGTYYFSFPGREIKYTFNIKNI